MTTETKFRAGLVITLLGLLVMTFEFFEKDRLYNEYKSSVTKQIDSVVVVKTDSLNKVVDSLETDLFNEKVINGKYEMGLDFLKERRPNEHNLVMNFINTQTE